jgi:hypothetical protein
MSWVRKVVPAKRVQADALLVGLELNATIARAMHGPQRVEPQPLALQSVADDLPMIVSLEGRRPEVGQAGARIWRQAPHLTCIDFLTYLGERREWVAGRHRLDAAQVLTVVFEHLQRLCPNAEGIVWAVPGY